MASGPTRMAAQERRTLVLRAAADAFAAHGFAGARLDEIAAAAGVTKPIVYRHFASKEELYIALLDRHEEDLPTFFARLPPPAAGAPPADVLRTILEHWFGYVAENGHAWLMAYRDASGGPAIDARRREVRARARAVFASFLQARADPPLPTAEAGPLAEILVSGLAGLALSTIESPDDAPPRDVLVDAALRVVLGVAYPATGR